MISSTSNTGTHTIPAGCALEQQRVRLAEQLEPSAGILPRITMDDEHVASIRIAVAEDEPDTRTMFVRLLEMLGHEVICAVGNGAELLAQCLDQDNVDVVFVDLDMPVMDGLAAAEEVQSKGIPVILISGHPDSESVVLENEPVVTRISKPATIDHIREAIELALQGRPKPR
jgi:CheY-like chemotaxis protein